MPQAWLSLGANLGRPADQLKDAVRRLKARRDIRVTASSTIIITPPWGKTDQDEFHNMAVAVETDLSPQDLLDACLSIEEAMGRKRNEKWGPRLIDIDLIAYEKLVIDTKGLTLPHPYAHERDFVLRPLREIAPRVADWIEARDRSG
ncbi:MAG TPA: 2-amino-4-hydroxy-6-hydroxymethyldihydropteridine diphosphokinase [Devosiaceae bacterium]